MTAVEVGLQEEACRRAARALGLSADAALGALELSVAFKYALSERTLDDGNSALDWLCATWDWSDINAHGPVRQALERDQVYRWRLIELARDAQRSQSLAPELCLAPYPLGAEALASLLCGTHNHAVVFAQSALITHELYPLVADAFTADSTAVGRAHFNILGVHTDWIDRSHRTQRGLFFDFDAQRFVETSLAVPLSIDSVHFLSLGHGEQTLHAHWSAHLPVFQINPWAQAQRADDKQVTLRAWTESGIDAPATRSITRADESIVRTWLDRYGALVVKPNDASEGRGVAYIRSLEDWSAYARELSKDRDLLLQVRRDRVFFRDREQGSMHALAVRIHVANCDTGRRADSHYVQLGMHADAPASRGRGGRIVSAAALDDQLVHRPKDSWQPVRLDSAFWDETFACAERAASAFPNLALVGLDFVVDMKDDRPAAIPIEANPRPAGLCHARRRSDGQSGVSEGLWNGLRTNGRVAAHLKL